MSSSTELRPPLALEAGAEDFKAEPEGFEELRRAEDVGKNRAVRQRHALRRAAGAGGMNDAGPIGARERVCVPAPGRRT